MKRYLRESVSVFIAGLFASGLLFGSITSEAKEAFDIQLIEVGGQQVCSLVQYNGQDEEVTIPSSYTIEEIDYNVTHISENAFLEDDTVKTIIVPDTVTTIGKSAFAGCPNLEKVVLPDSVTSAGDYVFSSCTSLYDVTLSSSLKKISTGSFQYCYDLESITIPEGVETIEESAFFNTGLKSINIPASVTSIEEAVFRECSDLSSITVDPSNEKYDSRNNCNAIIEKDTYTLLYASTNTSIPDSVTKIGDYAFYKFNNLSSLSITKGVQIVGEYAFAGCGNLKSVIIPSTIIKINEGAFDCNPKLDSITYKGTPEEWANLSVSIYTDEAKENPAVYVMNYSPEPTPTGVVTPTAIPTLTSVPTVTPTVTPTPLPTIDPGFFLTPNPTRRPTNTPTPEPTNTQVPTAAPTSVPTVEPTEESVVSNPEATPTDTNTPTPTVIVTETPVPTDAAKPTKKVKAKPTKAPTSATVAGNAYKIKGKEVILTEVSKNKADIVIPATVKIRGKKYKVTTISANALKSNNKLKSVTIGKNIKSIAANTFKGKKYLAKITVKTMNLKSIGNGAFTGISKKVTIFIPKKNEKAYKRLFSKAVKSKITYKIVK